MGVERDHRNGNDGQHVDRGNAVHQRAAENEAQDAEHNSEKDQDGGDERKKSAKGLLQMFLERAGDNARGLVRIGGFHVEPMDEQRIAFDIQHE